MTQEIRGFQVRIASRSAKYLDGATLDFKETLMGGGFSFDNPNPLWLDDLSKKVAEVIDKNESRCSVTWRACGPGWR